MLWKQCSPVLPLRFLDVYVDETVPRGIQVGVEGEHSSLIGDVRVLGVEVVHQFDPRQQAYINNKETKSLSKHQHRDDQSTQELQRNKTEFLLVNSL